MDTARRDDEAGLGALGFRGVPELDGGWPDPRPGPRLADLRARGEAFARELRRGVVRGVRTVDLLPFPYPVAFAFWQAAPTRAKYLLMRNRFNLIEFIDFDGRARTLLVNPTEADLSARAGYFEQVRRELLPFAPISLLRYADGPAALLRKRLGVDPARVDFVTFDTSARPGSAARADRRGRAPAALSERAAAGQSPRARDAAVRASAAAAVVDLRRARGLYKQGYARGCATV